MSYAAVTAKNAHQSPEEARAPPVPELNQSEATSTSSLIDVDSPHVSSVPSSFESQPVKTTTQADRLDREAEDEQRTAEAKAKAKAKHARDRASERTRAAGRKVRENSENSIMLANGVLSVALFGGLGYAAYVRYRAGELTWRVVGLGAAVLGAFSVADYYVTQYFFQKYPQKK